MSLPEIKTILYTTSMSTHTRPVFRHAIKLASVYQAKLVMLHVVEPMGETADAMIHHYLSDELIQKMRDEGMEDIKQKMQERVTAFYADELREFLKPLDLALVQRVVEGRRADTIIGEAKALGAGLIVMGSHNKLGRSSATTRHVIKYSGRPVFVVPTEG